MIKVVFFDIDGTLLHNKQVPDSTRRGIELLQEAGILPVLCTGRSEYEVEPLRQDLGIDYAITCNGAHIGYKGETIHGTPFPRELLTHWWEQARTRDGHTLLLYGAQNMFISRDNCPYFLQARQEIGFLEPLKPVTVQEIPDIYQCILFCEQEEDLPYLEDRSHLVSLHRWRTWAVDLNPQGVNKSVGIDKLLNHLGVAREATAAFGDGKNDIEMIQFVGRGIAMGNACPELLSCAPYVTRHIGEDGILHGIETLILQTS
jgi:Cof subfamily protein (haloacid dehalogenase superfamily)